MDDTSGGFLHMRTGPDNVPAIASFNTGFCRMLNMTSDELMAEYGDDAHKSIVPENLKMVRTVIAEALAGDGLYTYKYRLKKRWRNIMGAGIRPLCQRGEWRVVPKLQHNRYY